ncbi:MAG: hypothetical protein ABFC31_09120, partial [Clostridiaceae bacterium]
RCVIHSVIRFHVTELLACFLLLALYSFQGAVCFRRSLSLPLFARFPAFVSLAGQLPKYSKTG